MFRVIACAAITVVFAGCGFQSATSRTFAIQDSRVTRTENTSFKLARAQGIIHNVIRNEVASGKYFFDSDFYDTEFPNLTEFEFRSLIRAYSGWSQSQSAVKFAPNTIWRLSDFLPPLMQATMGRLFEAETRMAMLPNVFAVNPNSTTASTKVTTLSNCWGTAYEILRAAHDGNNSLALFYAPQKLAQDFFTSPEWSSEIRPFSRSPFPNSAARNQGLEPGDVLLVGDTWLQHVAIFIDDDFYFEKAGTGDTAMYRITHWSTLEKTWPPELHGHSWRRFNKQSIPDASVLFNLRTSLPPGTDLSAFDSQEIQNLTIEPNLDNSGKPVSATWMERKNLAIFFTTSGLATTIRQ